MLLDGGDLKCSYEMALYIVYRCRETGAVPLNIGERLLETHFPHCNNDYECKDRFLRQIRIVADNGLDEDIDDRTIKATEKKLRRCHYLFWLENFFDYLPALLLSQNHKP